MVEPGKRMHLIKSVPVGSQRTNSLGKESVLEEESRAAESSRGEMSPQSGFHNKERPDKSPERLFHYFASRDRERRAWP